MFLSVWLAKLIWAPKTKPYCKRFNIRRNQNKNKRDIWEGKSSVCESISFGIFIVFYSPRNLHYPSVSWKINRINAFKLKLHQFGMFNISFHASALVFPLKLEFLMFDWNLFFSGHFSVDLWIVGSIY